MVALVVIQLAIDLGIIHVMLFLLAYRVHGLRGKGTFHLDFKGRPGSPVKEAVRWQCAKLWEWSQRCRRFEEIRDARNMELMLTKVIDSEWIQSKTEAIWGATSQAIEMGSPNAFKIHLSLSCATDARNGATGLKQLTHSSENNCTVHLSMN